eukprot:466152-Prorocentrum_minimum.AAC.1
MKLDPEHVIPGAETVNPTDTTTHVITTAGRGEYHDSCDYDNWPRLQGRGDLGTVGVERGGS